MVIDYSSPSYLPVKGFRITPNLVLSAQMKGRCPVYSCGITLKQPITPLEASRILDSGILKGAVTH